MFLHRVDNIEHNIDHISDVMFLYHVIFLYYRSFCLRSVTPISEIIAKKVFDNMLGKCF